MLPSELPVEDLLTQLAEECGELIQAGMKLVRYEHGDTSLQVKDPWVLENNLVEEIADVEVVIDTLLNARPILREKVGEVCRAKELRWYDRLNSGNDE